MNTTAIERVKPQAVSMEMLEEFAHRAVASKFYGFTSPDQMLPLMIIAQSEGRSFASVVQEYSVIQGRPALKAEAMLSRFQLAGGKIKWTELSDTRCAAVFSHPQCEPVEIDWDMARARQAGLGGKDNWKKYPRNMLKARVISDGVRTAFPACLGGMYSPEEVGDFEEGEAAPGMTPTNMLPSQSASAGLAMAREGIASGEDGTQADHTQDPEWEPLDKSMRECGTKDEVNEWWEARKKALRERKPHFTKAFFQTNVIPFAASFAETVWEDREETQPGMGEL